MNFNAVYIEKGLLQVAKFRYAQEARFLFSYFIFCFLLHAYLLLFCLGFTTIINEMICVERRTQKKSEFQKGIEPTTFRTLVGYSNH